MTFLFALCFFFYFVEFSFICFFFQAENFFFLFLASPHASRLPSALVSLVSSFSFFLSILIREHKSHKWSMPPLSVYWGGQLGRFPFLARNARITQRTRHKRRQAARNRESEREWERERGRASESQSSREQAVGREQAGDTDRQRERGRGRETMLVAQRVAVGEGKAEGKWQTGRAIAASIDKRWSHTWDVQTKQCRPKIEDRRPKTAPA